MTRLLLLLEFSALGLCWLVLLQQSVTYFNRNSIFSWRLVCCFKNSFGWIVLFLFFQMILLLGWSSALEVVSSTIVVPQVAARGMRSWKMMSYERVFKVLETVHLKNWEPGRPWWSKGLHSALPVQGAWVQSLFRELDPTCYTPQLKRSCLLQVKPCIAK